MCIVHSSGPIFIESKKPTPKGNSFDRAWKPTLLCSLCHSSVPPTPVAILWACLTPHAQDCVPHKNTFAAGCSSSQTGHPNHQRLCPRVSSFFSLLALSQKGAIIASLEACPGGIQPFFQGVLLCKNLWCLPQNHSPWGQCTFYGSRRACQSRYKIARYTSMASKREKCRDSQCMNPFPLHRL